MIQYARIVIGVVVLLLAWAWPASGHQGVSDGDAPKPREVATDRHSESPGKRYFTNVLLVDQHGERRRLYDDLLRGKVVVITSFFTSCQASCPVTMAKMAALQDALGERLERDVRVLSLSIDPRNDTLEKVAAYASRFHAKPGWYLLTGKQANVDIANYKLGQFVEDPEGHRNIVVIGNESTGLWKKVHGVTDVLELKRIVDDVLADR